MSDQTETRMVLVPSAEIRAVEDDGVRKLVGYGVVFDSLSEDLGGFRETFAPTSFNRSLALQKDVLVTFNHNVDQLLGRTARGTARVAADNVGVFYEVDVPDTQAGRDAWTLAERGDLAGSSVTFRTTPKGAQWSTVDGTRRRRVAEAELMEIGPVVSPAYLDTTVAARSLTDTFPPTEPPTNDDPSGDDAGDEPRAQPTSSPIGRLLRVAR